MSWLDTELARNPEPVPPTLPERYKGARFTTIPESHPLRALVWRYMDEFYEHASAGIAPVLLGPAGEYKTYAAAVIAGTVGQRVETEFVSVPDQFMLLELDRYSAATKDRLERIMRVPMLVLDDFFWPERGSWASKTLQAVFAARFGECRPTLITGNLELPVGREFATLSETYSPLLARRLRDAGGPFVALLDVAQSG